ncbi:hypothetical protein [Staphylococcus epidermidis]|uniref:hypothetical protein n=1 Tax=Staphylococcus epidermidis TaxID=1282 RepID=UPI00372AD343|nr:hypothetical protein [Staphylococcus epidermidis]MCG1793034.1 hypothetical protein [Staphylococcus epidermidis]
MSQTDYQIKQKNIKNNTEETSAVSMISYEIENANDNGLDNSKIKSQIDELRSKNNFPKNLDYVDSYTDPKTGTTTTAFLNKDTGKLTVGMTGTNVHGKQIKRVLASLVDSQVKASKQDYKDTAETLKDLKSDANIGMRSVTHKDAHFKNTQQFIEKLQKEYDIDIITGHSLGGRDAIIIGTSNGIKKIVVYNPAPLAIKETRLFKKPSSLLLSSYFDAKKDDEVDELLKNYDGNILRIVSDKDELNKRVKHYNYVLAGDELILKNGKGHAMDGFMSSDEQKIIRKVLKKIEKYQEANDKTYINAKKQTENKLGKVDEVRANLLQASGGALSSSQQKLLKYLTALSIAEGLNQLVEEEFRRLKKMYNEMDKKFEKNWEEAQESGNEIGKHLSSDEVLSALDAGNVNEYKLVTAPQNEISIKLRELSNISSQYSIYVSKIKNSINEIVNKDQMLASQIGSLM